MHWLQGNMLALPGCQARKFTSGYFQIFLHIFFSTFVLVLRMEYIMNVYQDFFEEFAGIVKKKKKKGREKIKGPHTCRCHLSIPVMHCISPQFVN